MHRLEAELRTHVHQLTAYPLKNDRAKPRMQPIINIQCRERSQAKKMAYPLHTAQQYQAII